MGFARAVLVLLVLLSSGAAGAIDVKLAITAETKFDTNVERQENDEQQDVSFRFIPFGSISQDEGKFTWRLSYSPAAEVFATRSDNNFLSHFLQAQSSYSLTNKTLLDFANRFSVVQNLGDQNIDSASAPNNDTQRNTVITNDAVLTARHIINPRWVSDSTLSHSYFDSDNNQSVDSNSLALQQAFNYRLNGNNTVGAGGGATFQFFESVDTQPASQTQVYRTFASWQRQFGETTSVALRGGPAFIQTQQDDGGGSDSRFTFFGEASVRQRWLHNLTSSALYNRSESTANGLGASTIADRVTVTTNWEPTPLWNLQLRGDWIQRKAPTNLDQQRGPLTRSVATETSRWTIGSRISRRLTRRMTLSLSGRYSNQDTKDSTSGSDNFSDFNAILGIRYDFDPIRL